MNQSVTEFYDDDDHLIAAGESVLKHFGTSENSLEHKVFVEADVKRNGGGQFSRSTGKANSTWNRTEPKLRIGPKSSRPKTARREIEIQKLYDRRERKNVGSRGPQGIKELKVPGMFTVKRANGNDLVSGKRLSRLATKFGLVKLKDLDRLVSAKVQGWMRSPGPEARSKQRKDVMKVERDRWDRMETGFRMEKRMDPKYRRRYL